MVAVQQHYVKPHPNELSETLLTEDCKMETGLEEEAIKNSQPLEQVLEEVRQIKIIVFNLHVKYHIKIISLW